MVELAEPSMDWRRRARCGKGILDCGARECGMHTGRVRQTLHGQIMRMLIVVALAACLIAEAQAAPDLKAETT